MPTAFDFNTAVKIPLEKRKRHMDCIVSTFTQTTALKPEIVLTFRWAHRSQTLCRVT